MSVEVAGRTTLLALAFVVPAKMITAWATTWMMRGHRMPLRYLPIELARSALNFVCWLRACASRTITWRGNAFILRADSAITPAPRERVHRPRRA